MPNKGKQMTETTTITVCVEDDQYSLNYAWFEVYKGSNEKHIEFWRHQVGQPLMQTRGKFLVQEYLGTIVNVVFSETKATQANFAGFVKAAPDLDDIDDSPDEP